MYKYQLSARCYLDCVDDIVSIQAGSQLVNGGSVHILQSAEEASVQVEPVLLQSKQVEGQDKLLQLINDLIHLQRDDIQTTLFRLRIKMNQHIYQK